MSKGSNRRKGTGYADNWDRIFGKKEERKPSGGQIWMRKSAMESPYLEQAAAARALEDARHDVRDKAIAKAIQKYGTYSGKVWYIQPDGSLLPADGGKPNLITLSEAMKAGYSTEYVNCGPSASGAVIRVGKWDDARNCFQYIDVRPDEPPPKTCQHCKHFGVIPYKPLRCENPEVVDMAEHDNWDSLAYFEPPADFGCNRWEAKA